MPNRSKQKGQRAEYYVRDLLREHGIPARLTTQRPQSAGVPGDLLVCTDHKRRCGGECTEDIWEVKARRDGWRELHRWLEHSRVVAVKADRRDVLVVMRLVDWA